MCGTGQGGKSESGLIERARDGDIEAFNALFDKYRKRILAYVFGMVGDRGAAEDIVQECFVELARRIGSIKPEKGASAWLYRVARNRAIDLLRHRRFEVLPGDAYLERQAEAKGGAAGPSPEKELAARELRDSVRAALDRLPPGERDLLMLRFYGDLTFKEIAAVVGRPISTVLWQVRKSLGIWSPGCLGAWVPGCLGAWFPGAWVKINVCSIAPNT